MIDYLIRFKNEDEAKVDKIVARFLVEDEWDTSQVIVNPSVYDTRVSDEKPLDYFYLSIATPKLSLDLYNHPTCMLVTDRDAALDDKDFVMKSLIPAADMGSFRITPMPAGSDYPQQKKEDAAVYEKVDDSAMLAQFMVTK